jgi:non-ribosomal peptide synthetase component E (peptide arylation enzyme)
MAHQTGFLGGIVLPILWGATIVYQEQWDPEAFIELIARHKIEVTNGNATFLLDVLRARNLADHVISSFKIFRAGGGPIRTVLINEAREKLPGLTILRGWGQSENGVVTMTQLGDPQELLANSDGRAQPGMSVQIVDHLNHPLPPGVEGRLQCKGAFQFAGYLKQADVTRSSYVGDWFETGDLAIKLDDRYIRITGRSKDVIIRGGEKIPVKYVEDVLHEDERVVDAAIVAMPDSRLGEKACAFVICRPHSIFSLQEMQRFLEQQGVAKQYWPERLEICSELPRAANGKIRKAELRTRISAAIGREQSVPVPAS